MRNWSVDEKQFKNLDKEQYAVWRLEQLINFGLDGEKISEKKLKKYWKKLDLDPKKKDYLKLIIFS